MWCGNDATQNEKNHDDNENMIVEHERNVVLERRIWMNFWCVVCTLWVHCQYIRYTTRKTKERKKYIFHVYFFFKQKTKKMNKKNTWRSVLRRTWVNRRERQPNRKTFQILNKHWRRRWHANASNISHHIFLVTLFTTLPRRPLCCRSESICVWCMAH